MRRSKHLARAILLLGLVLAGFFTLRAFVVPETFGEAGHFRYANLAEQRAKPVKHGGRAACRPCHETILDENQAGSHKTVHCEGCHAPVVTHADFEQRDGPSKGKIADMPRHRSWRLCARCHQRLQARPETFPQVDIKSHLEELEMEYGENVCIECHDPHSPME
ncbi:MAG: cytochrome C [Planctomycetota bacterium]